MSLTRRYFEPLLCIFLWAVVFGVPALLAHLNPPPSESTLTRIHGRIVYVSDQPPNLKVLIDHNIEISLRFPAPLYSLFSKRISVYLLSDEEKARLNGCEADLYGADIRYVWPKTFRVWAIDCKTQPVSYQRIAYRFFTASERYSFAPWVGAAVALLFVAITFDRGRKKK